MLVPIYIEDSAKAEENLNLGFTKNKNCMELVDLHFRPGHLSAFWVDPDINDDTDTRDIILYIKDNAFRTPYSKETYEMLKSCIDKI